MTGPDHFAMSADLHTLLDADPAAGLRGVAALMRSRAEAATPGPWRDMAMGSEGSIVLNEGRTISTSRKPATCREFADAEHIASWHPAVVLAVADWLDYAAHLYPFGGRRPLTVARAYLGAR